MFPAPWKGTKLAGAGGGLRASNSVFVPAVDDVLLMDDGEYSGSIIILATGTRRTKTTLRAMKTISWIHSEVEMKMFSVATICAVSRIRT